MTEHIRPGINRRALAIWILGLALLVLGSSTAFAGSRHFRVGTLWDEYGSEGNEAWGGTCMVWPGGFWKEDLGSENFAKASCSYKGFLYSMTDYVNPPDSSGWALPFVPTGGDVAPGASNTWPRFVVQRDITNSHMNSYQLSGEDAVIVYKSNPTEVTTDGTANAPAQAADGPEDPTLAADAKIMTSWHNQAGIRTVRTLYAFVHPDHDDYHVWHYNFKNDGKYCCAGAVTATGDPDAVYPQTINDFHFTHSLFYMDRAEGGRRIGDRRDNLVDYQATPVSDLKEVIINYKYGPTATYYANMDLGSAVTYKRLRAVIGPDADNTTQTFEDSGDPHPITGRMMSPRWPGLSLVHCDTDPGNEADDNDQPQRFDYGRHRINYTRMDDYTIMEKGWLQPRRDGNLVDGWLTGAPVSAVNKDGFIRSAIHEGVRYGLGADNVVFENPEWMQSVGGPNWDLAPGDDVNAIWVSAVAGIPYQETVELGNRLRLPVDDPNVLTEEARLKIYYGLEDELYTILERGHDAVGEATSTLATLETQLAAVPTSPPNPATFTLSSGIGQIDMTWTGPSSRTGAVAGYRIYRARGSRVGDFPWVKVADLGASTLSYSDENVSVGIDYFYYLVTVNSSGTESSAHMARTQLSVSPSTSPETAVTDDGVYVVPNPYNLRYQEDTFVAQKGGVLPGFAEQVVFYGLPAKATIHIYTLDGFEIQAIEHDAAAGTEPWDLLSRTGQPVVSGVYVYVVESTSGNAVGKLVIVR